MSPPTFIELFNSFNAKTDEYIALKEKDPNDPRLGQLKEEYTQILEEARKIVESGT